MKQEYARAFPRKNFFVQMFTRDIGLEDCILDLVDNSIDGLIRSRDIKLSKITKQIFSKDNPAGTQALPSIKVTYSDQAITIKDNCGGIDINYAKDEVFNFGHGPDWKKGYLGVFGVGLKRALFKIGDEFGIYSQTLQNGFSCHLIVSDWIKKDEKEEDWRIPIEIRPPVKRSDLAGTFISVKRLHDEVRMRLRGGLVDNSLYKSASRAYTFFIQRYVNVFLNGKEVKPFSIPLSKPTDGHASFDEFSDHGVNTTIFATVAEPDDNGHYNQDQAGWYVVCNGRIVLHADKSELSGWGISPMPTYQPKHRSFIGLVIFEAENPLLLPWTTTKRALNKESPVYLRARSKMAVAARPVLSFIDKQYPGEVDEEPSERLIARSVKGATVGDLVQKHPAVFSAPAAKISKPKTTSRVQFDANISDLEKVRSHLRKPRMGASKIGEYTLRYFLDKEGLS